MNGQDLYIELQQNIRSLNLALKELSRRGQKKAESECDYRIALADKILIERDRSTPVTIISDVCRGDRKIAKLKLERDIAETLYKSAEEAINVYKLNIRVIENQVGREWTRRE
jgi:hypothetical protein